jgi:hypothetical protein
MCGTLSKRERARFSTDQIDGGTADEKVEAYSTYISYTGSFEVDEEKMSVTHLVKFASFPNFVGRSLTRYLVFSGPEGRPGDEVRLNTPPMISAGRPSTPILSGANYELSEAPTRPPHMALGNMRWQRVTRTKCRCRRACPDGRSND